MTEPEPPDAATLVCLHFLGGSARGWSRMAEGLPSSFSVLAVDLPGFGDAAAVEGYDVASMADHVAGVIAARTAAPGGGTGRFVIAGHSMGAKVAALLARRAEDGDGRLAGLSGLVLLAGSPPGPEPMADGKRREMLGMFGGDATRSRREAHRFIADNLGTPGLDRAFHEELAAEVLRARRAAWVAWLETGSREDWTDRIGRLRTPALVISGTADEALGHEAQREVTLPHLLDAEECVLPEAGHLLPMERPALVARLIAERFAPEPAVPAEYRALMDGERVSPRTRGVLRARLAAPAPVPEDLSPASRATLRAALARIVPQEGPARIDLAGRLLGALGGVGDGWRPALLPPDEVAWAAGLRTLDALGGHFAGQEPAVQDALLRRLADGRGGLPGEGMLDGPAMQLWFQELRGEAVRQFVAHPATYAAMGYAGFAYGAGAPDPGFPEPASGRRERWEPAEVSP